MIELIGLAIAIPLGAAGLNLLFGKPVWAWTGR